MKLSRCGQEVPVCAAAAVLACAFAAAQTNGGGAGQNSPSPGRTSPGQQPTTPGQPNGPATPGGDMTGMPSNSMPSYVDQSFVRKALEDNVAQVQMGQLAAQKLSSDDVKQFGQKMAQIHEQLSDQLKPVAKKLGVSEPKGPSRKDKQEIAKMQALSGRGFRRGVYSSHDEGTAERSEGFQRRGEDGAGPGCATVGEDGRAGADTTFAIIGTVGAGAQRDVGEQEVKTRLLASTGRCRSSRGRWRPGSAACRRGARHAPSSAPPACWRKWACARARGPDCASPPSN